MGCPIIAKQHDVAFSVPDGFERATLAVGTGNRRFALQYCREACAILVLGLRP